MSEQSPTITIMGEAFAVCAEADPAVVEEGRKRLALAQAAVDAAFAAEPESAHTPIQSWPNRFPELCRAIDIKSDLEGWMKSYAKRARCRRPNMPEVAV